MIFENIFLLWICLWLTYLFDIRLPRDIQAEAIPLILGGGDVLAVSCLFVDLKKNQRIIGQHQDFTTLLSI
jgi:hypothetical protein